MWNGGRVTDVLPHTGARSLDLTDAPETLSDRPSLVVPGLQWDRDFTIEFFVHPLETARQLFCAHDPVSGGTLFMYSNAAWLFQRDFLGAVGAAGAVVRAGAWNHVAVSFAADARRYHASVDGVTSGWAPDVVPLLRPETPLFIMVRSDAPPTPSQFTRGYVDDIRVSRRCRYTGDYVVPDPLAWGEDDDDVLLLERFAPDAPVRRTAARASPRAFRLRHNFSSARVLCTTTVAHGGAVRLRSTPRASVHVAFDTATADEQRAVVTVDGTAVRVALRGSSLAVDGVPRTYGVPFTAGGRRVTAYHVDG